MLPRTFFSGLALVMLPLLSAGQGEVVNLNNKMLNMRDLVLEAGRQTGVSITLDLREDDGPTVLYDCQSTLRQIIDGVRGYFLHRTGLELKETWTGEKQVHLRLQTVETEITAVQVEGQAPVPAPKRNPLTFKNPFKGWFLQQGTGAKDSRMKEEPFEETKIKRLDLGDSEVEPEDHPLEEVPETVPTRLVVETLPTVSFGMSPKDSSVGEESLQPDLIELLAPAENGASSKEAVLEAPLVAPSQTSSVETQPSSKEAVLVAPSQTSSVETLPDL